MHCFLCRRRVSDVDAAIEAGWWPGFDRSTGFQTEPVCGDCAERSCSIDEYGELALHPTMDAVLSKESR